MSLKIRFRNVYGEPPDDHADVHVFDIRTDNLVGRKNVHPTTKALAFTAVEPGVEDVYFSTLAGHLGRRCSRQRPEQEA